MTGAAKEQPGEGRAPRAPRRLAGTGRPDASTPQATRPNHHIDSPAAGAISLRQSYECWKAGADPIEYAKEHKEFARAFESFPGDADKLYPGWREKLGVHK